MSAVVLTTLYNKLIAVQTAGTVYELVAGKIYQLEAPQSTAMPLLVYAMSNEDTQTFMVSATSSMHTCDVAFTIYCTPESSVVDALAIESALFLLLHKASMTPSDASYSTIASICMSRGVPTINTDSIVIDTMYRIFATKQT